MNFTTVPSKMPPAVAPRFRPRPGHPGISRRGLDRNGASGRSRGRMEAEREARRNIQRMADYTAAHGLRLRPHTKTLTSDLCLSARESGHGLIVEYPGAKIARLSEEHGSVDVSRCATRPKPGERVTVIPNHICPCVNLQDNVWWCEANEPPRLLRKDTRGRLS